MKKLRTFQPNRAEQKPSGRVRLGRLAHELRATLEQTTPDTGVLAVMNETFGERGRCRAELLALRLVVERALRERRMPAQQRECALERYQLPPESVGRYAINAIGQRVTFPAESAEAEEARIKAFGRLAL